MECTDISESTQTSQNQQRTLKSPFSYPPNESTLYHFLSYGPLKIFVWTFLLDLLSFSRQYDVSPPPVLLRQLPLITQYKDEE